MSTPQPVCPDCWRVLNLEPPPRFVPLGDAEDCCLCGELTSSGLPLPNEEDE